MGADPNFGQVLSRVFWAEPVPRRVLLLGVVGELLAIAADVADVPVCALSVVWPSLDTTGAGDTLVITVADGTLVCTGVPCPIKFVRCPFSLLGDRPKGLRDFLGNLVLVFGINRRTSR